MNLLEDFRVGNLCKLGSVNHKVPAARQPANGIAMLARVGRDVTKKAQRFSKVTTEAIRLKASNQMNTRSFTKGIADEQQPTSGTGR